MHSEPPIPDFPADDTLPPALLEALRKLPSEQGGPCRETDAAIMATARETLAAIRRRRIHLRLWPVLAAAACAIFALTLFSRPSSTPAGLAMAPAEDKYALILREVSAVFPQQIKAIFSNGSDLQIALADQPLAGSEQAVVIEVCENGDCTTVITYVGQSLEIGQHRVTVRADESGGIVIDSPDFQDSSASPAPGLHIKTRRI